MGYTWHKDRVWRIYHFFCLVYLNGNLFASGLEPSREEHARVSLASAGLHVNQACADLEPALHDKICPILRTKSEWIWAQGNIQLGAAFRQPTSVCRQLHVLATVNSTSSISDDRSDQHRLANGLEICWPTRCIPLHLMQTVSPQLRSMSY